MQENRTGEARSGARASMAWGFPRPPTMSTTAQGVACTRSWQHGGSGMGPRPMGAQLHCISLPRQQDTFAHLACFSCPGTIRQPWRQRGEDRAGLKTIEVSTNLKQMDAQHCQFCSSDDVKAADHFRPAPGLGCHLDNLFFSILVWTDLAIASFISRTNFWLKNQSIYDYLADEATCSSTVGWHAVWLMVLMIFIFSNGGIASSPMLVGWSYLCMSTAWCSWLANQSSWRFDLGELFLCELWFVSSKVPYWQVDIKQRSTTVMRLKRHAWCSLVRQRLWSPSLERMALSIYQGAFQALSRNSCSKAIPSWPGGWVIWVFRHRF